MEAGFKCTLKTEQRVKNMMENVIYVLRIFLVDD